MEEIEVEIDYKPRPLQEQLHDALDAHRFSCVVCHRRFGKTVMAVNQLVKAAALCQRERPRFSYLAPTYRQGKAVAWDYLKHYTRAIPGVRVNESELHVTLPHGGQVRIYGADNPDALRGIYLDGVIPDEFGLMPANIFSEVIRPALSDREGWACFIGTPNGKNQFYDIAKHAQEDAAWFFASFKASQTGIIPQPELDAAKSVMTPDEYEQEFECSFEASVKGAIFASEIAAARAAGRIGKVHHEPTLPVHTWWDLGVGDSTAIWFMQFVRQEVRIIDYYENSGEGLPHYAQVLQQRGYVYGEHWAPHDIQVRELGSGRSRIESARSLGVKFRIAPNVPLEDGINAARILFVNCWFDEQKCKQGLECLQNYRRDYNTRIGEFKAIPVHDWASHGADAFRYFAVSYKERGEQKKHEPQKRTPLRENGFLAA